MSLSSHRSEASYAHSHRKWGGCSSKQVKLLRKATNAYNRAVRRSKQKAIAFEIAAEQRCMTPVIPGVYHANFYGLQYTGDLPQWVTDRVTVAIDQEASF